MTFVVVGSRPDADTETMQPELVACPYCETVRRVILPFDVAAPIVRTLRAQSGEPFKRRS
jgi:hypothetical protein